MTIILKEMNSVKEALQKSGTKRLIMMIFSVLLMGFGISLFAYILIWG